MTDYRAAPTAGAYQTTVQLLRVPLRIDDENQMYFANQTAQNNYFQSVIWKSLPSQTYQRENAYFRVDDDYDAIVTNCNYLRYKNAITGNNWFYAYITEFEYKNPNTTFVHFKIDAYQTYLFDITWKDCFIEREHVKSDAMGTRIVTEPLNYPKDVVIEADIDMPRLSTDTGSFEITPILLLTECPELGQPSEQKISALINGVPQSMYYWVPSYAVSSEPTYNPSEYVNNINAFRDLLIKNNKIDTLVGAFCVPRFALFGAVSLPVNTESGGHEAGEIIINSNANFNKYANSVNVSTIIPRHLYGVFTPKNNKIYTSQFYEIIITNHQGGYIVLKPEYLTYYSSSSTGEDGWRLKYSIFCGIAPDSNATLKISEDSYNSEYGNAENYYTLSVGDFPVPSMTGDYFSSWLSGHEASTGASAAAGLTTALIGATMAGATGGAAAGVGATMVVSGLMSVVSSMASVYDASQVADPLKTNTKSTGRLSMGLTKFSCYIRTLSWDNAEKVDNYFTMFGYKVNELKVPEFGTRQYYNYYKMPVCNITGNIPQTALDEIRAKFQRGITLWNTSDVGNYRNGNNPIVTS